MICRKCFENLPAKARFCPLCGQEVSDSQIETPGKNHFDLGLDDRIVPEEVQCPQCGRLNLAEMTFRCRLCGQSHLCLEHRDKTTFMCKKCAKIARPLGREDRQAELEAAYLTKNWRKVAEKCQSLLLELDLAESARSTLRAMVSEAYYWIKPEKDFDPVDLHSFLIELNPLFQSSPDMADLWWMRGLVRFQLRAMCFLGEWEDVLSDFKRAIEINPTRAFYHFWHGRTYFWADDQKLPLGNLENALKDYDHAIELDPNQAYFYRSRGIRISFFHRNHDAIDDFNRAIELDPDVADFYLWRGNSYDSCFDYQSAIDDYTRAIKLEPRVPDFYIQLGLSHNEAGDYLSAISNFSHAIELNPNIINYYRIRGVSYHYAEDYQHAIEDFTHAIELDPTDAYSFFLRGISYINWGDAKNAIEAYSRAIRLDSNVAGYYRQRGVGYALMKDHKRAIEDFNRAIELDPSDADYFRQRSLSYKALGKDDLSLADEKTAKDLEQTV